MKWHETKKKRLALTCLVSGLCVRVSNNQPLCRWGMQSSCHQLRVRENLVARNLSRSLKHTGGRRWLGKKNQRPSVGSLYKLSLSGHALKRWLAVMTQRENKHVRLVVADAFTSVNWFFYFTFRIVAWRDSESQGKVELHFIDWWRFAGATRICADALPTGQRWLFGTFGYFVGRDDAYQRFVVFLIFGCDVADAFRPPAEPDDIFVDRQLLRRLPATLFRYFRTPPADNRPRRVVTSRRSGCWHIHRRLAPSRSRPSWHCRSLRIHPSITGKKK